ncbi:MAG TPA: hypothetical protein VGY54_15370, partial [Polyangiaceae bacterium]|nr:hypothetical protein [Polyangiaceae bacterium]
LRATIVGLLGAAAVAAVAPSAPAGMEGAAIVRGNGRVRPDGAHEWRDTTTADVLTAGISVQASTDAPLEMNLPDGVSVTLEPGSLAHWQPPAKLPSEVNTWTHGYHLVLIEGELEVRMPLAPKGAHAFLVSTKAGTLTDWRGQLHVKVHDESTAAAIYEGALVVGSNGIGFPVYDGAGILIRRGVNPDKSRVIPASPQWDDASGGFALEPGGAPSPVRLSWQTVPNVASYRVEIAADQTMVRVIDRVTTSDPNCTTTNLLEPGKYWAHVRAVGKEGIVGAWSAPRLVRVVRYELPEGAFVAADGAIVMPDDASVFVPGSEGLQVAYEPTSALTRHVKIPLYWSTLAGGLRLSKDAPVRVVHLRDPTSGAETRVVLARRQLRARVELAPSNARWPLDPIDARITVTDPSGRLDLGVEPVFVEATLDLIPLGVAWQRSGSIWTGRIAPRHISDPSIVRVVVKDGRGAEIGRGFVELEPVASPN